MIDDRDRQRSKVYAWEERFVADRLTIRLADVFPSWWLLHELAHAMTSTHDGRSDGHGPTFMGLYAQLLTRYLRVPADALLKSLHAARIEVDIQAEPVFIDYPQPAQLSASSGALARLPGKPAH